MISFRDYILYESFDLNNDYVRLNKKEMDEFWLEYFNIEDKELLGKMYQDKPFMKMYITKNSGRRYIIITFIVNSFLEVHFYDRDLYKDSEDATLNLTKNSLKVFSVVMSIVLKELTDRPSRKIKISSPDNRQELYRKIIEKVLIKFNINKNVKLSKTNDGKILYNYMIESLEYETI
jgi:hypothetical protein